MSDPLEFGLDVLGGCDIAVGKMAKVKFHTTLETPFERHVIDGPGALTAIHGWVVVIGRIEMRAVVGRKLHSLHRPGLTFRQILRLQSRKEAEHARQAL